MRLFPALSLLSLVFLHRDSKAFNYNLKVSEGSSNLADAVDEIINKVLVVELPIINIVNLDNSSSFSTRDFNNKLLSKSFEKARVAIRLDSPLYIKVIGGRRKRICIFPIDTFSDLLKMSDHLTMEKFHFNGYFTLVLASGEISEIEAIFDLLWNIQIYRVIVLFEDRHGTVQVQSFLPFREGSCHNTTPVVINEFKAGRFQNGVDNIFPEFRMKNLYKCPIRVAVTNDTEPFIFAERKSNGNYDLSGPSIQLVKTLSEIINFEINYTFIGPEGFFYENGTSEGPLKALMEKKADLSIANWWLKQNRLNFFGATNAYYSDPIHFIIPPGRDYTAFEKLIFPFTLLTWCVSSTCLLVGLVIIFLVNRNSEKIRNFVFGAGVKTPYWNMFIGLIGGNQNILPGKNFARFLLMTFLLYSLVLRTLYQGSYYQFLQSNRQHKKVETIEEMVENDFSIYVDVGSSDLFSGSEIIKNRFVILLRYLLK